MKLRSELSADKLRGGYYTPEDLVAFCWRRISSLTRAKDLTVLEPAAGDGQFFRFLDPEIRNRIRSVVAVEIEPAEAAKCRAQLARLEYATSVRAESFLTWALTDSAKFDVAVGNPPFLRFQFVSEEDNAAASVLGLQMRLHFEGVSNLWIPLLLGALSKLRDGGAFSFVVPAELFTGLSAGVVRRWLLETTEALTVDLFPAGSFRGVLQEVVVLSGRRVHDGTGSGCIELRSHRGGASDHWTHTLSASTSAWTRLLLSPKHAAAFDEASALLVVQAFGSLAKLQVSIVTGANDYFCVDDMTREKYDLTRWSIPLLPRVRHASGLIWKRSDQNHLEEGTRKWLVHFADDKPSPERYARAKRYLELGMEAGIDQRYKCQVRSPWFRVPHVWAGTLLLSKRSHRMPRLLLNAARTFTTDTIYRGRMLPELKLRERDLVAGFHNSLTLLASEIEGRSFGGGVHELVPSEISRLQVPFVEGIGRELDTLDELSRHGVAVETETDLVAATDELLARSDRGLTRELLCTLSDARHTLMWRRLERSSRSGAEMADEIDLLAV